MDKGKPPESNKPYLIDCAQYSKSGGFSSIGKEHNLFLPLLGRLRKTCLGQRAGRASSTLHKYFTQKHTKQKMFEMPVDNFVNRMLY